MGSPRLHITPRRGIAVLAFAGLAAAAWFLLLRGESDDGAAGAGPLRGPSAKAAGLARELSRSEQVDQVLLVGFDGTVSPGSISAGGILVGAQNWVDRSQGTALVRSLAPAQAGSERIPPLIVAAQEGGAYRSFADLPPAQRQLEIGDEASGDTAAAWASETAAALAEAGFDLNLFPVADVATLDSPIADRAFSDDSAVVAALTAAALRGCEDAGLACAPLHFPGVGAASQDTAEGPATVSLDAAGLESRDLEPFRAARSERAEAMVLSLALYPAYNAVTPAALAPEVATGLLRDELRFEGLAISDDLSSGAVKATYSVPDAAVAALGAGTDLLQISAPSDQAGVREAILAAVESGRLPPDRLIAAAGRVLDLKRELGLVE